MKKSTRRSPFPFILGQSIACRLSATGENVALVCRRALLASFCLVAGAGYADTIALTLNGNTDVDLWGEGSLTAAQNPFFPAFPGTGNWPNPIGSASGGDAYLKKISNGPGGGPFPSGAGIYYGGFDVVVNTPGGTLAVADDTALAGVKTISFQMQIGQAYGYDLLDNDPTDVTLSYTTASGVGTLSSQAYAGVLNRFYNGSVPMPTGPGGALEIQDIYVNLWGFQWDLSGISEPILSYEIKFTAVQHASMTQLQLNQSDAIYGNASVFPPDFVWNSSGADTNWSTGANWNGGAAPASGRNVTVNGATSVLDSARTVGTLTIQGPDGATLAHSGDGVLNVVSGIKTSSAVQANYTITAPVNMSAFGLVDVDPDTTLTISSPITGSGFYKQGGGNIFVTGNNTYNGSDAGFAANGLIFKGGINTITGTNTITGSTQAGFHLRADTTVILSGGDHRLDPKFTANLGGVNSRLVLGTAAAVSNQTFTGFSGALGSQLVAGGSADLTTLTINGGDTSPVPPKFEGRLGGDGPNENNLALVKTGSGVIVLSGRNTYNGGTTISGGAIEIGTDAALGTGVVTLNGGTLRFGAAFSDLREFSMGPAGGSLDSGALTVTYNQTITGPGRFTKTGSKGTLILTGINNAAGGTAVTSGYLAISADDRLGTVPATATPANLQLNAGGLHVSEDLTLQANRGVALGGAAGNGNGWLSVAPGKTLTYGGVVANAGTGAGSLFKLGSGTLVLSGANTYTGTTDVYHGKLLVDYASAAATSNLINFNSSLRVYGGTLEVKGSSTAAVTQTFGATTTIGGGHSTIKVDSNGGAGTSVGLNALSRTAGATLNIDLPASGNVTTSTTTTTNGLISALAGAGPAYITVNKSDWATLSGSNVVAFSGYETSTNTADWGATENVALSGSVSGVTSRAINSLKLTAGADVALEAGQTLSLTAGGVLVTGTGASEITGGTIVGANGTAAATKELAVFQYNTDNALTIGSVIANSSTAATALTKSGDGTLILTAANTYSGITRINGGILSITSATALGTSSATSPGNLVLDGGTLRYTGEGGAVSRAFTLGYNGGTLDASGTGPAAFASTAQVNLTGVFARTLTLTGTNTGDNSLSNSINDSSSGVTSIVKNGTGTWLLAPGTNSNGNNGFTGGVKILGGTLKLGRTAALNGVTGMNRVDFGPAAGTKLAINGFNTTLSGLGATSVNPVVENGAATNAILTINNGGYDLYAGTLRDGAGGGTFSLGKSGPGTLELSGTNSYTGTTAVTDGRLLVSGSLSGTTAVTVSGTGRLEVEGSIHSAAPVTIERGGILGGNGQVGPLTLNAEGILEPGSSAGDLQAASLLWNSDGVLRLELGADALSSDKLTLLGALTKGEGTAFTFELIDLGVVAGTTYELINFSSTTFTAADFSYLADKSTLLGTFSVDQDSVNFYAVVPEPSTAVILLGAIACLGLRRGRRPAAL